MLAKRARNAIAISVNMHTAYPYMHHVIALARAAGQAGAVPVAAVVVCDGKIVGEGRNLSPGHADPTAHAEIMAIRAAALALGRDRLDGCDMWVSLEPCAMCAGAISHARLARLYYAADDAKGGAVAHGPRFFSQPTCHHAPEVYGGICESEASILLRDFFVQRR
jgi:tRNA(adenine34) deaminase